jgi:peptidoglycan/LPS O-acetylase OafA/YrhL
MIAVLFLLGWHAGEARPGTAEILTSYAFIPWPGPNGHPVPVLPQGWTLNYEAFFYLSFAAALMVRRGLALLAAAFIALVALHPLIPPPAFVPAFWSDPIILEFLAGIALAQAYLSGLRLPPWASVLCAALAPVVLIGTQDMDLGMFSGVAHLGAPALLLSAAMILAPEPKQAGPLRKALHFGGDISYTLYLSHIFTVGAASAFWRRTGIDSPWLGMALAMILAIAAAAILYRWVERPMTECLQRRARLAPAPLPPTCLHRVHFVQMGSFPGESRGPAA